MGPEGILDILGQLDQEFRGWLGRIKKRPGDTWFHDDLNRIRPTGGRSGDYQRTLLECSRTVGPREHALVRFQPLECDRLLYEVFPEPFIRHRPQVPECVEEASPFQFSRPVIFCQAVDVFVGGGPFRSGSSGEKSLAISRKSDQPPSRSPSGHRIPTCCQ